MIGTGTGVAPFFSIIEEKYLKKNSNFKNLKLVFGFRKKDTDFIKKDFIEQMLSQKILN